MDNMISTAHNPLDLPNDLPAPIDDGACNHLCDLDIPSITLKTTDNTLIDISKLKGIVVIYCYPRTGRPGISPPEGWDNLPGARGCTPQSCAFKDHHVAFMAKGIQVFGLSTQVTAYQQEAVERLHLPFPLISDSDLIFTKSLKLPTFIIQKMELIKRLTLVCISGKIKKVFYPVFPPDKNAEEVMGWIGQQGGVDSEQ